MRTTFVESARVVQRGARSPRKTRITLDSSLWLCLALCLTARTTMTWERAAPGCYRSLRIPWLLSSFCCSYICPFPMHYVPGMTHRLPPLNCIIRVCSYQCSTGRSTPAEVSNSGRCACLSKCDNPGYAMLSAFVVDCWLVHRTVTSTQLRHFAQNRSRA